VLARVLLYVIEPARPIDSSFHDRISRGSNPLDHVKYTLFAVVNALDNARAVECSSVTRLSAAGWVERRAVKDDRRPTTDAIGDINHASFKLD
jgi:hypothetical protein